MAKRANLALTALSLSLAINSFIAIADTKIKASFDFSYINTSNNPQWLNSWQDEGTGVLRYDATTDAFNFRQGFVELDSELTDSIDASITAFAHKDGDQHVGITEAFITYKPLASGWLKRYRVGMFYPKFSTENVAGGWQSPYTYSYSAINSWLGEELRVNGIEAEFIRLGRRAKTDYDLSVVGAIFIGNDPIGTLLSWRGWAIHDRQSLFNDRVEMANYPTIDTGAFVQPSWVNPIKEVDGRPGYYLGVHYKQKRKHDIRLYIYDNLADPGQTGDDNQYSWRSKFASLAWKYRISPSTQLLTQAVYGASFMGDNEMVDIDFFSAYAMLTHKTPYGRFSGRIERFLVKEKDSFAIDANDSDGNALTLAWRFPVFDNDEIGIEYLTVDSYNENRQLWGWRQQNRQSQVQAVYKLNF